MNFFFKKTWIYWSTTILCIINVSRIHPESVVINVDKIRRRDSNRWLRSSSRLEKGTRKKQERWGSGLNLWPPVQATTKLFSSVTRSSRLFQSRWPRTWKPSRNRILRGVSNSPLSRYVHFSSANLSISLSPPFTCDYPEGMQVSRRVMDLDFSRDDTTWIRNACNQR